MNIEGCDVRDAKRILITSSHHRELSRQYLKSTATPSISLFSLTTTKHK
jgi:hypothetical protein